MAGFKESFQAVDWIEERVISEGIPGDSYGKVTFGTESKPHHFVYFMEDETIGIQNTKVAKWPVIVEDENGSSDHPQTNIPPEFDPQDFGAPNPFSESDTGADEADEADEEDEEDVSDDETSLPDQTEEDDDGNDDETMDNENADAEAESETDEDADDDEDNPSEDSEKEIPVIFAKMRGPKSWRKRAETDPEKPVNLFKFVIGVLRQDDTLTTAKQEADRQVTVEFRQKGDEGKLKIIIPSYAELLESSPGVYTATLDLEEEND